METSPFNYHPFLLDQSPAFSDPMITTGFSAQLHQPYEQVVPTSSIEVKSGYANQASIGSQILDSSMSMAVVHDHQSEMRMPCAQTIVITKLNLSTI